MAMYLTISEGPRAEKALPILATGDERIVRAVLQVFAGLMREAGDRPGTLTLSRQGELSILMRRAPLATVGGDPDEG